MSALAIRARAVLGEGGDGGDGSGSGGRRAGGGSARTYLWANGVVKVVVEISLFN